MKIKSSPSGGSENIALGRPAFQISIKNGRVADKAVDGNMDTDQEICQCCSNTKIEVNPWWAVDLGSPYTVTSVALTNRYSDTTNCK